jgi:hypothetical protein
MSAFRLLPLSHWRCRILTRADFRALVAPEEEGTTTKACVVANNSNDENSREELQTNMILLNALYVCMLLDY